LVAGSIVPSDHPGEDVELKLEMAQESELEIEAVSSVVETVSSSVRGNACPDNLVVQLEV